MSFLSALGSFASSAGGGSLLGGIAGSAINGLFSARNTDKANQAAKDMTNSTNQMNYQIAQDNLAFQRENLDYQKALQQKIFEREDTSYERTVNDMRNAGLSPLSMQNTNGAGEAIATNALNNDMRYEKADVLKSSAFEDLGNSLMNLSAQSAQIDSLRAQAKKAEAEAEDIRIGNGWKALMLEQQYNKGESDRYWQSRLNNLDVLQKFQNYDFNRERHGWNMLFNGQQFEHNQLQNSMADLDLWSKGQKAEYDRVNGLNDGMTETERAASILAHSLGFTSGSEKFGNAFLNGNKEFNTPSESDIRTAGLFSSGMRALTGLADFLPMHDIFAIARGIGKGKQSARQHGKRFSNDNYQEYLDTFLPF